MHFKHKLLVLIGLILILTAVSCSQDSGNSQSGEVNEPQSDQEVNDETSLTDEDIIMEDSSDEENESTTVVQTSEPVQPVSSGPRGIHPSVISIPSIDVRADIEDVGILDNGQMGVPDDGDTVGWFHRGAKPGASGNAVMAGHVDDRSGPAIFYELDQLDLGDRVYIENISGEELVFEVTRLEVYPYDDAPIDVVFGPSSTQRLNLITCTGEFDRNEGTHRERLVVFTELIQEDEV